MPWGVPEFRTGLVAGIVAATVLLLIGQVVRRTSSPLPLAGIALVTATGWAIADSGTVPWRVIVGVAGIGVVAVVASRLSWPAGRAAMVLPFAYILARDPDMLRPGWVTPVVVAATSIGAVCAMSFESSWGADGLGPTLYALSATGVYFAVPDTERAGALLGAAVPIALVAWPTRRVSLGRPGAAMALATLMWVSLVDGIGRPASIVGAVGCLGLLVGEPLARLLMRAGTATTRRRAPGVVTTMMVCAQGGLVVVSSRVAGTRHDVGGAGVIVSAVLVCAVVLGAFFVCARPAAER